MASDDGARAELIALHVAEYQTLTTRCTHWMIMQLALWPVIPIYLGLVAQVWSPANRHFLSWGSGVVLQVLAIVEAMLTGEAYRAIRYIEHRLRPATEALVGKADFWGYERYMAERREAEPIKWGAAWWEYPMPLIALVGIVGMSLRLRPFSAIDWWGLLLNGACLTVLTLKTIWNIKTRWDWFSGLPAGRAAPLEAEANRPALS